MSGTSFVGYGARWSGRVTKSSKEIISLSAPVAVESLGGARYTVMAATVGAERCAWLCTADDIYASNSFFVSMLFFFLGKRVYEIWLDTLVKRILSGNLTVRSNPLDGVQKDFNSIYELLLRFIILRFQCMARQSKISSSLCVWLCKDTILKTDWIINFWACCIYKAINNILIYLEPWLHLCLYGICPVAVSTNIFIKLSF